MYTREIQYEGFQFIFLFAAPKLREYPVRFAWAMVDMYDELTAFPKGQSQVPKDVPPAIVSFRHMLNSPKTISGLEWAKLDEVYTYLRQNKHLQIPLHWKRFLPRNPFKEA